MQGFERFLRLLAWTLPPHFWNSTSFYNATVKHNFGQKTVMNQVFWGLRRGLCCYSPLQLFLINFFYNIQTRCFSRSKSWTCASCTLGLGSSFGSRLYEALKSGNKVLLEKIWRVHSTQNRILSPTGFRQCRHLDQFQNYSVHPEVPSLTLTIS